MAAGSRRTLAFEKVLGEELRAIDRRRESVFKEVVMEPIEHAEDVVQEPIERVEDENGEDGEYQRLGVARRNALRKHLVGLALSGGGIRSATFAVGVLQGLGRLELIKRIDFLSTVSGGGFAGSWLAAWIKREGSVSNVEKQLAQSRITNAKAERQILSDKDVVDEEPEPIYHLRAYSRYMAPRAGLLTADAWSVIATYVRNISINLLMLLSAAMIVVLCVRLVSFLFHLAVPDSLYNPNSWFLTLALFATGGVYFVRALRTNASAVNDLQQPVRADPPPVDKVRMLHDIVVPLLVAAVFLTLGLMSICWWLLPEMIRNVKVEQNSFLGGLKAYWLFDPDQSEVGTTLPWFWEQSSLVPKGVWNFLLTEQGRLSIVFVGIAVLGWWLRWKRWTFVVFVVLAPLVLTMLLTLTQEGFGDTTPAELTERSYYLFFPVVFGVVLLLIQVANGWRNPHLRSWSLAVSAFVSGIIEGLLFAAIVRVLYTHCRTRPDLLATFAPPAFLFVYVTATVLHVARLRHKIKEDEREWWAYFDAYLLIVAFGWLAIFGTILYMPAAVHFTALSVKPYARPGVLASLISTWAGTTLAGILAGKSRQTGSRQGKFSLEMIAAIAPPVFLVGLFTLLSVLASTIIQENLQAQSVTAYFAVLNGTGFRSILLLAVFLGLLFKLVSGFVDVNLFSLNAMYANRLVRCYVGASRKMSRWDARWDGDGDQREGGGAPTKVGSDPFDGRKVARRANPVTGFDLKDDIPLASFQIGNGCDGKEYWGPHLLINTSLNLVDTENLAWVDRKSESFVLSPSHCGSKGTGYAKVPKNVDEDLTIGRAIAVSGAAVDPNMNYHQSAALTAFLTIFNARLGYWIENPSPPKPAKKPKIVKKPKTANKQEPPKTQEPPKGPETPERLEPWTGKSPRYGPLLVSELRGATDSKGEYVHLSDGGHFENTGVYELVRRRCRYIIACDASPDPTAANDNLANLVRLVRIDFGIRIEIDMSPLQIDGNNAPMCRSHVVIGSVRYDDVDNGQVPGVIIYIRTSMTGDEPPDILNYATVNREFPHTSTANQFFDEAQFESYRALGAHVARVVFEEAKTDTERTAKLWSEPHYDTEFRQGNNRLFAAVRRRWSESLPVQDARFLESTRDYIEIQKTLRTDPALRDLSFEVYPELSRGSDAAKALQKGATPAAPPATAADGQRVELYAVAQMLQAIENTWFSLDLKSHPDAPVSHGWWSIFRRWTATEAFHRNWPILRTEFSAEFVRFVETRLGLIPAMPEIVPWFSHRVTHAEQRSLIAEFDREWPKQMDKEANAKDAEAHLFANRDDDAIDRFLSTEYLGEQRAHRLETAGTLKLSLDDMIQRAAPFVDTGNHRGKAVWGILQESKPRSVGEAKISECRGIVLVFEGPSLHPPAEPTGHPDYELLIWVRRAHRGIGLGSYAMEKILKMIDKGLDVRHPASLHARYPRVDDDDVRSMWKRFYSLYDFYTKPDTPAEGDISVCLHRRLEGPRL